MMPEQADLLLQARDSLGAARLLHEKGYYGYAASRAYYAMFYVAESFLLGKSLAFSKHSAVHAAFAEHFTKTDLVPKELHRYLIRGMETRHLGDYGKGKKVTTKESMEQISRAERFLEIAEQLIGPLPPPHEKEP